jgi:hypothetical protein
MRILSLLFGVPAAAAAMAVSMGCNWIYFSAYGATPVELWALGALSVIVDVFKAMCPFWISRAWAMRRPIAALGACVFLVLCVGLSFSSAVGFAAKTRGTTTGGHETLTAKAESAANDLTDIEGRVKGLPSSRPVGVIEADIERAKKDALWKLSKDCAEPSGPKARDLCKGVETLRAEMAAAVEAARLRDRADKLKVEIKILKADGAGQDADPQASALGRLLGQSISNIQEGLNLWVAVLVEFSAAFGMYFVFTFGGLEKGEASPVATPLPAAPSKASRHSEAPQDAAPEMTALPAPRPGPRRVQLVKLGG